MKSGPFQRMAGDMGVSACVPGVRAPLFTGFLLLNMCFRGSFSGGASAKDKGHRGHRERFFCSSGFQIIQGRREGASRPSFSPFSPSLIEFPSLDRHVPSVRRRPRPNHTFLPAPVGTDPRRLRRALRRSRGQNTKATAGDSRAPSSPPFH